jgi:TrmH family RNA methyltransferase
MISSVRNPKVQQLRALQSRPKSRRASGSFVVEGVRLAEEALRSGWNIRSAYHTKGIGTRGNALLKELKHRKVTVEEVSEPVMKAASDTETPQGVLLELALQPLSLPAQLNLVLILDGIADPGNVGTLLRSAAAAGAGAVLLAPGSADPFSPKVLRAGMGAHFYLPVHSLEWPQIAEACAGLQVYLAESGAGEAYDKADLRMPCAFIVGGEAHGVSEPARKLASASLRIPMPGRAESLNAAMAGAVLLFEALRQRRQP